MDSAGTDTKQSNFDVVIHTSSLSEKFDNLTLIQYGSKILKKETKNQIKNSPY